MVITTSGQVTQCYYASGKTGPKVVSNMATSGHVFKMMSSWRTTFATSTSGHVMRNYDGAEEAGGASGNGADDRR